jgi:indolepyruvate ferredoxin oxidoreductase alpha subunit
MAPRRLLSGNEAIALGAWEAGVSVATGYPGTPSTEILENLRGYEGVWTQWSANEKVALEVGSGASFAGARVLVTMKHVGLNVAADPLFTLSYTGVTGGLVVVTADDPQLFSSQNEQDNRHYARAAKVPILEPSDSREARDLTRAAFELSERFDTPVLLRTTTRLSHSLTPVGEGEPPVPRREGRVPAKDPGKLVMVPAHGFKRHQVVEERIVALREFAETFPGNRIEPGSEALGVIAAGVAYEHAREALPEASFLKLSLTWPFPEKLVRRFCSSVRRVAVVEELDPFLEEQVKALGIETVGKDVLPRVGEYTPAILAAALLGRRREGVTRPGLFPVPTRPPFSVRAAPTGASSTSWGSGNTS